jgi:gliding motility-associated-like protein
VPGVFSPNGDGVNDVLKPVIPGLEKFRWFKIYNRWGNLVFETLDPDKGWDGKYKGVAQQPEAYIWIAEGWDRNGALVRKTGILTLTR